MFATDGRDRSDGRVRMFRLGCRRYAALQAAPRRRVAEVPFDMTIQPTGLVPLLQVFDMPEALRFYRDALGRTACGSCT